MQKYEVIRAISENVNVEPNGENQWLITSYIDIPVNGETKRIDLSLVTTNEEDYTGIFNGAVYNRLCGFDTEEEIDAAALELEMWTQDYQQMIWMETTNEFNYEPIGDRNYRLAEKLYNELIVNHKDFKLFDIES